METIVEREIDFNEEDAIGAALLRHRYNEGNTFVKLGDLETTLESLKRMAQNLQVVKFYEETTFIGILVYDVGKVWWSDKLFLMEELVLCVNPDYHGFARHAIAYLDGLAEAWGVDAIIAGCYFQQSPQVVINSYKKNGFDVDTISCVKVVKK